MSKIYRVENTDNYVALTNPASVRQIVTALKNEGLVKRNARIASFSLDDMLLQAYGHLRITYLGHGFVTLWPEE